MHPSEASTGPAGAAFAFMVSTLVYATIVPSYIEIWLDQVCEALPKFISSPPDVLALIALLWLGLLVSAIKLVVYIFSPLLYLIIPSVLFKWEVSRISQALVGMGLSSQPQIFWSQVTAERELWFIGISIIALPLGWIVQWYGGRSLTFQGLLMGLTCLWTVVLLALMAAWMILRMCAKVMKLYARRSGRTRESVFGDGEER